MFRHIKNTSAERDNRVLGDRRGQDVATRNRRRASRSAAGLVAQIVSFSALVALLMLSLQRQRAPARAAVRFRLRKRSVGRWPDDQLSSSGGGDALTDRPHRIGPAGVVDVAYGASRAHARRRDGVAGFLVGLLLVTLALASAVALAAQSVQ